MRLRQSEKSLHTLSMQSVTICGSNKSVVCSTQPTDSGEPGDSSKQAVGHSQKGSLGGGRLRTQRHCCCHQRSRCHAQRGHHSQQGCLRGPPLLKHASIPFLLFASQHGIEHVQTMGKLGAEGILAELASRSSRNSTGVRMLTHCNTGSLATAAYGTALGVVRALHAAGSLQHAYCTETRPYNQGAD